MTRSSSQDSLQDKDFDVLRIRVIRGINLAVRDINSSDPYVIFHLPDSNRKVRTRTIKRSLNPVWNEDLTIHITDPKEPIQVNVYDHDRFSLDDKMGEAKFDIKRFMEVVGMNLQGLPDGTIITTVQPNRGNDISEESRIIWKDGKVTQNMFLRLKHVESGEIELQIQWMGRHSV